MREITVKVIVDISDTTVTTASSHTGGLDLNWGYISYQIHCNRLTLRAPWVESSSLVTEMSFLAVLSASLLTSPNLKKKVRTSGKLFFLNFPSSFSLTVLLL
jgi:hypothetical protein